MVLIPLAILLGIGVGVWMTATTDTTWTRKDILPASIFFGLVLGVLAFILCALIGHIVLDERQDPWSKTGSYSIYEQNDYYIIADTTGETDFYYHWFKDNNAIKRGRIEIGHTDIFEDAKPNEARVEVYESDEKWGPAYFITGKGIRYEMHIPPDGIGTLH